MTDLCSVENRNSLIEAAKVELARLQDIKSMGYEEDIENDITDIDTAIRNMQNIANNAFDKLEEYETYVDENATEGLPLYSIYRTTNGVESSISAYDVQKDKEGNFIVKYLTEKLKKDKTITIPKNGKLNNTQYDVDNLEGTYEETRLVLGSTAKDLRRNKTVKTSKYEKLELDIHNDVTKTVEMLDEINKLDNNSTSVEHMSLLKELLGSLNPKFFKEMTVYLRKEAATTGGVINSSTIALTISKTRYRESNAQTAAEVYAHELIHAYTMFAIDRAKAGDIEARKILRRLQSVMNTAADQIKWHHLLGKPEKDATDAEIKIAKEMHAYIFAGKNAEHEFVAHALTNPIVLKALKKVNLKNDSAAKTLFDRIKNIFTSIVKYMSGDFNFNDHSKNAYEATKNLAFLFAEYNNKAKNDIQTKASLFTKLKDAITDLDEATEEKLSKLISKLSLENTDIGKMPTDRVGKAKYLAKYLGKIVTDRDYRTVTMTYLDKLGIMSVSGSIASIIRDFVEADELEKTIDWLQINADKVDQQKMNVITTVKDNIKNAFNGKLTTKEDQALKSVIVDNALHRVFSKKQGKTWANILTDESRFETALINSYKALENLDKNRYKWHLMQAKGLGYFMATGKGHIGQNLNTHNIARGYMSNDIKRPWKHKKGDLEAALDMVATLEALKHTSKEEKALVANLIENNVDGIYEVIGSAKFAEKEALETAFDGKKELMIQGYTKDVFDDSISLEIAKLSDKKDMEAKGYKLVSEVQSNSLVTTTSKYGVYVSDKYTQSDWHRATTRLTKTHTKGTALDALWQNEDTTYANKKFILNKLKIDTEVAKMVKKVNDGTFDWKSLEYGLVPIMNEFGEVVNYRYMMDKEAKKKLLKQDTRLTESLGATRGSLLDKQKSNEHNKKVLEVIVEDAKTNYLSDQTLGKEGVEYVLIKEDSADENIKELWKVLPRSFKAAAYANEEKALPVRKDMLHNYFGYREATLSNFPGLNKVMPTMLKNAIKVAEAIWQEFIKIAKVDILIKMPFVIVGNIISNMMFALTTGTGPIEIMKMYTESTRDVRKYLTGHRELVRLTEEVNALMGSGRYKKTAKDAARLAQYNNKIKMLQRQLEQSPIHELYEMGVYQAIVEDVNKEELSNDNRLKKVYKEKLEKAPKVVKDGLNWLYLTEETQYYKFMSEVLQMSDLVARDIENRKLKKTIELQANGKRPLPVWYISKLKDLKNTDEIAVKLREMQNFDDRKRNSRATFTKEEKAYFNKAATEFRKNYVLNNFINYNKVSGPVEEYLNKMGVIMFTKYAKRIQRVIAQTGTRYPLKTMMALLFDTFVWDMETIQDQSLFTRSWYNVTPQTPWSRVLEVMEPALVQMPKNLGFSS